MDVCTVVFRDEIDILHQQAQSLARWLDRVDNIYVIVNDHVSVEQQIDRSHWGRFSDRVHVINRTLFGHHWADNGWVSQQVLKLSCAALSQSDWCMVLDAKTILVTHLPAMINSGRLCVGTLPVYPVFEPSRLIVNQLWNIDLQRQLGPGGVPFWFKPTDVRAMISDIEIRTQQQFVSWFQAQGRLTEFVLYSGWIEYCYGLDAVVTENRIQPCNICHSELGIVDQKLDAMSKSHTVSIHRHAWGKLTSAQQQRYQNFLAERLSL